MRKLSGSDRELNSYTGNGLIMVNLFSIDIPSCISSDQSVSQPACRAEAAIIAS